MINVIGDRIPEQSACTAWRNVNNRAHLQGRAKFPTGGDSPRTERLMQCDSATDSIVWMEEDNEYAWKPIALKDVMSSGFLRVRG